MFHQHRCRAVLRQTPYLNVYRELVLCKHCHWLVASVPGTGWAPDILGTSKREMTLQAISFDMSDEEEITQCPVDGILGASRYLSLATLSHRETAAGREAARRRCTTRKLEVGGEGTMRPGRFALAVGMASTLFISGVNSTECVNAQTIEVSSTADAQHLSDALTCTGGGVFDVIWYGSVSINQTIEVPDGISLTITGSGFSSSLPLDRSASTATILGVKSTSQTGMFHVSGASTLNLDNLVLQGGYSDDNTGAGAVKAQGASGVIQTVNVTDCHFKDNYGHYAGVWRTPCLASRPARLKCCYRYNIPDLPAHPPARPPAQPLPSASEVLSLAQVGFYTKLYVPA